MHRGDCEKCASCRVRGAHFQKRGETYCMCFKNRPKHHRLADVMRMLGALVRPHAAERSFTRGVSVKRRKCKMPRSRQGAGTGRDHTSKIQCPQGCSLLRLYQGARAADGTRDILEHKARQTQTGSRAPERVRVPELAAPEPERNRFGYPF